MNSMRSLKIAFLRNKLSNYTTLILFIFLSSGMLSAQTDHYIDSLIQIVDFGNGKEKLEALDKLVTIKRHHKDGLKYTQLFEKEALLNGSDEMLGRAYLGKAKYYYIGDKNIDSAHYYLNKITPLK